MDTPVLPLPEPRPFPHEALSPDRLFRRVEALLRVNDLPEAQDLARRGACLFPAHGALRALPGKLAVPTPEAALEAMGCARPWHLAGIPRKAHFYWGSERTSFLRYLSVASFHHLNPDWELNLYVPATVHRGRTEWADGESYEGTAYHGRDYGDRLLALPGLRIREVDFHAFPGLEDAPETFKADAFRWQILHEEGGIYSDTDILFLRPLREAPFNEPGNRDIQAGICLHRDVHIIGFYLAAPGAPFFQSIARHMGQAFDASDYQALGSHLLNRLYPTLDHIRNAHPDMPVLNLPMDLVYPVDWMRIPELHQPGDPGQLPPGSVGVHWYAGSSLTQRYNNLVDHETCGRVGTLLDALAHRMAGQIQAPPPSPAPSLPVHAGPTFSVLVPSYNQAHFLPATLDSLMAQTRGDWEAVVVDDGSRDATLEVLADYAARDPRIRFFHQENGGVGAALNRALAEARGTWICWLSSDDLYESDALEAFAQGIADHPGARFFYSNFSQLFEESGEKKPLPTGRQLDLPPFEFQTLHLLQANYINGITICIQRTLFDEVGTWKPEFRHAQDLDLWLRMSARTRLYYLDHHTAVTRVHPGQDSRGFPMAGFYDSARAALTFLNDQPFEAIFPWLDLRSEASLLRAVRATLQVALDLKAFFYQGVGPNTALLERMGEWMGHQLAREWRATLPEAVKSLFGPSIPIPAFLREGIQRLGTPAGSRYVPRDPLALMAGVMHHLEAAGETELATPLRRYLELVGPVPPPPAPALPETRRRACIVLVRPEGYVHAEAFRELVQTLQAGFESLGIPVEVLENEVRPGAFNLVVAWHLLTEEAAAALPAGTVLYNLEQMDLQNAEMRDRLVRLGQRLTIWDYSPRNLALLKEAGLKEEHGLLPIGYTPSLTRVPEAPSQDIDVLFYGSSNARRIQVFEALQAAGLTVQVTYGSYGPERDALIARAKVVLNLHYFDSSIFEMVRVSYLLANRKAVVAECGEITEVDPALRDGLILAPYDGLVEACRKAVEDESARRAVAQRGFERMADRAIAPLLRPLLEGPFGLPRRVPQVSVIVPTRDRPEFLARALDSIRTQTFPSFEVIVINDGGTDVAPVMDRMRAAGMDLTLVSHPTPLGQAAARNTGIRSARGAWIAYLDDDDLYYPEHLQTLVEALQASGAQVAYTDSMRAIEKEVNGVWVALGRELAMSHDFDREHFLRDNLTPVNNVMHARRCWEEVGPQDETLPVLEDWDFWIRLSRRWDFIHVPKATTEIRWRKDGTNATFERQAIFPACRERIARKVEALLEAEARTEAHLGREAFLCEPDWRGEAWAELVLAYFEAFRPQEGVRLVLVLDPAEAAPLPTLASVQATVVELAARTGRETFPEVAVVDQPAALREVVQGFDRIQWIPAPGTSWPLLGPRGRALRVAERRLKARLHPA